MKLHTKQEHSQANQQAEEQAQVSREHSQHEFQSVEDLLRADARQVNPPGGIAQRLNRSLAAEPRPPRTWWRRLLKKG